MAEKRAAFSLRRFLALGFSKRRRSRNCCRVCSRSSFFLSRRMARSTGSPFFSFTSDISQIECITKHSLAGDLFVVAIDSMARAVYFTAHKLPAACYRLRQRLAQVEIPADAFP